MILACNKISFYYKKYLNIKNMSDRLFKRMVLRLVKKGRAFVMNTLHQDVTLMIGSAQAIYDLAQKDVASLLVLSDSHGNYNVLMSVLKERCADCDALVFCGDGVSDLCYILECASEDDKLKSLLPPVIAFVEGNCDEDIYPYRFDKSCGDDYSMLSVPLVQRMEVCGHKLVITHGHRFSLFNGNEQMVSSAAKQNAEIVLFGHTHVARSENVDNVLTLNPGSCARPRGGQPPCYAVLNVEKKSEFFTYTFFQITGEKSEIYFPEYF